MDYTEVVFTLSPLVPARDILTYYLGELGYESFAETNTGVKAYIPQPHFNHDDLKLVCEKLPGCEISTTVNHIPSQNWNAEWESQFDPIRMDSGCLIRAPFHSSEPGYLYEIIINPQMSFGTGHHHTTQLMVRQMLELELTGGQVADVGCGTGVLAVLAEKMGAQQVYAVDIDDWAFENTKDNIKLNNSVKIAVNKGTFELLEDHSFTLILANINKNVLKHDLPAYSRSLTQGGTLLLSGFFVTDARELIEQAEQLGLVFAGKQNNDDWAVLKFMKPETE